MFHIQSIINLISFGGIAMYPLIVLAMIATALIIDKILYYRKSAKLVIGILELIDTFNFSWKELEQKLMKMSEDNIYRRFFLSILNNRSKPVWWTESRAADESMLIQKQLNSGLWALETIVTVAPLLGLFGTIIGMMNSFKIIGNSGLINPAGVTSGVAEALIATAFGLIIAIIALFAFNYFSKLQDQTVDTLERFGTRVIDHIRLDRQQGRESELVLR